MIFAVAPFALLFYARHDGVRTPRRENMFHTAADDCLMTDRGFLYSAQCKWRNVRR